jgi:hypothetical protein
MAPTLSYVEASAMSAAASGQPGGGKGRCLQISAPRTNCLFRETTERIRATPRNEKADEALEKGTKGTPFENVGDFGTA